MRARADGGLQLVRGLAQPFVHRIFCRQSVNICVDLRIVKGPGCGEEFEVEIVDHIVDPVPPRVVRPHHSRAVPRPAAFMMPQFPVIPLDIVAETCLNLQQIFLADDGHDLACGDGELFVVEPDDRVKLVEMPFGKLRPVAGRTDIFHIFSLLLPVVLVLGNRWAQCPLEPLAHVVGRLLVCRRRHVARGACGGFEIIHPHNPVIGFQVHIFPMRKIGVPVLGLFVDLLLGMVRPQVALGAGLWLARLGLGEGVPCMAGVARPL